MLSVLEGVLLSSVDFQCKGTVASISGMPLPLANVTACGVSVLADVEGKFSVNCSSADCTVTVWARQFLPVENQSGGGLVTLQPRPIPGFPAKDWKFEGWPIEAQTGSVAGTGINFLAHPSAYRPPTGNRVFLTSTANKRAGPGWTQGYWQTEGSVKAKAMTDPLVNGSNPAMHSTAFTGRMIVADGRLLMLIGMNKVTLLENKNLEDPSHPQDWVPAEGNGSIQVDFDGAPSARHEDYRLHHFDQGYNCSGVALKNWLFIIPDGVSAEETAEVAAGQRSILLNSTNLRSGNLRQVKVESRDACSKQCDATDACKAWVYEQQQQGKQGTCFLKNPHFCVNPAADPCGGCEHDGKCPCSAGIKPGVKKTKCGPAPAPGPKPGRACGRMGFASANLTGPYKFCHWLEQPDPQGLDDPGGPGSNCDSWPGDLIQSKDGALYFVNGWGNIYKAAPGTLSFKRLPGNATIARPSPSGSYDDLHQIEFTFLPPRDKGGRWLLFHASYAAETQNPAATRADYGFKQAIGMYSFTWDDG